ncbi:MAG: hypothetical protein SFY66_22590 [Oculatellaceae cyanobacterium bins.114]|nr:hypothetical protein [Oculatellaceae cyanobacterium bins.114]
MAINPHEVELQIEEIVLRDFVGGDRHQIRAAIQQELTRLLTEQGIPPSLMAEGSIARLDGGSFDVAPDATPEVIGTQIARSIYGGVGG